MSRGALSLSLSLVGLSLSLVGGGMGCGGGRGKANLGYVLGTPGASWEVIRAPGGADRAWRHAGLSATIYADANCGDQFADGALGDLLTHLTAGMAQGLPLREETLRLDNRAALLRVYDVALDGVALRLGAAVTLQHPCTYDLVYLAPRDRFEEGWADFVGVVSGFAASGGEAP